MLGLTAAQWMATAWTPDRPAPLGDAPLRLVVLALSIQLVAFAAAGVRRRPRRPLARRSLLLEAVNLPLAWILTLLLMQQARLEAVAVSVLALGGAWVLHKLDRTLTDLREADDALASRVTELATLHAIGRELLSSLETGRICTVIERECRKIFAVDAFFVALADKHATRLEAHYRRTREDEGAQGIRPLGPGLATTVALGKRAVRIDDLETLPEVSPYRRELVEPGMRAVMAVPLIVEERIIGVVSIQSKRPNVYDDHQLEVLTTVAQQAAVAIDNATHYQMATFDSLTGFHSRDYFFRRLDEEYRRVARYRGQFALLMLDLDGFKGINDRCGHLAGDQYLRSISDTIRDQLRDADIPCRYGGDEFCLLMPETDLEGARVIAERIRDAVSAHVVAAEGHGVRTTVSIGLAAFPEHDTGTVRGLLRNADEALYRAKRQGRDRVVPFAA